MAAVVNFLLAGFTNNSGQPLNGGLVYTYSAGTTTPKATYTDNLGVTPEANPVVLDSNGRKQIYGIGSYKFVVKDSSGTLLYTFDNLFFGNEVGVNFLGTTSGSGNTYTATPSPALSSYVDGNLYTFQADKTNTGTATLNISAIGAKTVSTTAGEITAGFTYTVRYSSGSDVFRIVNPSPGYATTQAEISALNTAGVPIYVKQNITLTGGLTLTAPLIIQKGGKITTGSFTLAVNGEFQTGAFQCFDTSGGGAVTFGTAANIELLPEWWGAVRDGSTDDTTAIQKALTAGTGRTIRLLGGTYKITSALSMTANSRLLGMGYQKTVMYQATANTSQVNVNNDNEVAYIKWTGTGALSTLGNEVIFFDPTGAGLIGKRCWVHHNYFDNTISTSGIGGNYMIDVWLEDNIIDYGVQGEHGIYISGNSTRVYVRGNTFNRTGTPAVASCRALHLKGATNLIIQGNYFYGSWDSYAIISNTLTGSNITIDGNFFNLSNTSNLKVIATGQGSQDDGFIISNNYIIGGVYGIWCQSKNTLIHGNYIQGTGQRGIELDGTTYDVSGVTVSNNMLYNCVEGIRYQAADDYYNIDGNSITGGAASAGIGLYITSGSVNGIVQNNVVNGMSGGNYSFSVVPTLSNNWTSSGLYRGAATGIAGAGTIISDATVLSNLFNKVTSGAGNSGVKLWAAPSIPVYVWNTSGATIKIWPDNASSAINGGSAGAAISLTTGRMAVCIRTGSTTWLILDFAVTQSS